MYFNSKGENNFFIVERCFVGIEFSMLLPTIELMGEII